MREPAGPRGYMGMARHTAWSVGSLAELNAWRERLVEKGIAVSDDVQHEVVSLPADARDLQVLDLWDTP